MLSANGFTAARIKMLITNNFTGTRIKILSAKNFTCTKIIKNTSDFSSAIIQMLSAEILLVPELKCKGLIRWF